MQVLFVDDDSFNTLLAKKIFTKLQLLDKVIFVNNGAEALDYINIHLSAMPTHIFLDENMPVMRGSEFLTQLKLEKINLGQTKVVLMDSSTSSNVFEQIAVPEMIHHILQRPLQLDVVKSVLGI